ncbi:MAG: ATP-dependent Clp protease proteolytic subunit [Oscillibacter sp.]|nr:ATP-dependent Clp protease proteolytic subunit [Oscillibacter sp.]
MIPMIIKETSEGISRIPLEDALFQKREIFCVGEITRELAYALTMQLRWLQTDAPGEEIAMYIDSPGGEVSSGLAVYDVMQAIQCPIRTVCTGTAYSMASLLFAAGKQRDILSHARVMIHDPLITGGAGGSALHLESIAQNLMQTRSIVAEILAKHTGHTISEVLARTATDTYFNATEAVAWGLADRIITTL